MMLKKSIIAGLCAVSFMTSVIAAEQPNNEPVKQPQYGKFIKKLGLSVGLGILIGATEGTLCYHGDRRFPFFIIWFVLIGARKVALTASEKAMDEANVSYDKSLLENSAWITSWVAYIMTWQAEKRAVQRAVSDVYLVIDLNSIKSWLGY